MGGLILAFLFVRSLLDLADPSASYSGGSFFGIGLPLVIGLGFLLLGAIFMVIWRFTGDHAGFFSRRPEIVDPDVAVVQSIKLLKRLDALVDEIGLEKITQLLHQGDGGCSLREIYEHLFDM